MPVRAPDSVRGIFRGGYGANPGPSTSGGSAEDWISRALSDIKSSSAPKQMAVGGVSGFTAGYISAKFGKAAAAAIGGTLILVHLGSQYGYITIDWDRLQKDAKGAKKEIQKKADQADIPRLVDKVQKIVTENVLLASSFGGGFLLGLASA